MAKRTIPVGGGDDRHDEAFREITERVLRLAERLGAPIEDGTVVLNVEDDRPVAILFFTRISVELSNTRLHDPILNCALKELVHWSSEVCPGGNRYSCEYMLAGGAVIRIARTERKQLRRKRKRRKDN